MCLSGATAFTGAMCVVLTTKGRLSCYFWGFINVITYGLFAFAYGYAGDAQLNIFFFLPLNVCPLIPPLGFLQPQPLESLGATYMTVVSAIDPRTRHQ
jgi:hypothetical protein